MPTLPEFHDGAIFPTSISYGTVSGPRFLTTIIPFGSGREQRNVRWPYPRHEWNVGYGVKSIEIMLELLSFFYARRGRAYGFRFHDHDDFAGTNQLLGTGDGSTTDFQLVKIYEEGTYELSRKITRPVLGTVTVRVDDVEVASGVTIDHTTGIVSFGDPPSSGEEIRADFEFHIPMRFNVDWLPKEYRSWDARIFTCTLIEDRE
jgi:uncharacterized protein (TIGR02217 family)